MIAAIIAGATLALDILTPHRSGVGILYVLLVIAGWWFSRSTAPFYLAGLATFLSFIGYIHAPAQTQVTANFQPEIINRTSVVLAVWMLAIFVWKIKSQEVYSASKSEVAPVDSGKQPSRESYDSHAWSSSVITALEVAGEGLFVVSDKYKIEHMNKVLVDMFGDRTGETCYQAVADRDGPCDYCKLPAVTKNEETVSYEPIVANGKTFSIFATPFRNEDGSISKLEVINDITVLRDAEQKLVDAIESISEGFVLYDADHRLVICNSRFKEFYGYSDEEAAPGAHADELGRLDIERGAVVIDTTPEDYVFRRIGENRIKHKTFMVQLKDGRILETRDRDTVSGGIVSIQEDVTEYRMARKELQESHEELESRVEERTRELAKSVEKVGVANRAKSELMANVSHELRTPLNAIIGFSDFLKGEAFGPLGHDKYRECVEDIAHSSQHLLELISDILDVSAIESGKLELHEDDLSIAELAESSIRLVKHRAKEGSVELETNIAPTLPRLHADARRVKQILLNLLSNAVKFTPPDGKVSLEASLDECGAFLLTIRDTGVGMTMDELAKAMTEFGQVGRNAADKHEGAGLGLPLTKGLVELHGGNFDITSEKGTGTSITVTFPNERVVGAS